MSAFVNDNYRGVFLDLLIFVAARNDSLEVGERKKLQTFCGFL